MINDLVDLLNPKGGRGLLEAIVAILLIVGLLLLNFYGIEVSKMVEYVALLFFGYLWGNRPKQKTEVVEYENKKRN